MMSFPKVDITLIVAGATQSDVTKQYLGHREEPVLQTSKENILKSKEKGLYPPAGRVYSGGEGRCLQTARTIYAEHLIVVCQEFNGYDYGDYTGENYLQAKEEELLLGDGELISAIYEEECEEVFLQGENIYGFKARVMSGFVKVLHDAERNKVTEISIITHREVAAYLLQEHIVPRSNYHRVNIKHGESLTISLNLYTQVGRIKRNAKRG